MRPLKAAALATLLVLSILADPSSRIARAGTPQHGLALAPGDRAPTFIVPQLEGRQIRVKWTDHPATVVNFWATWCEPCRDEMPALQGLYERRQKDGLSVIGILMDLAGTPRALDFAKQLGVTYTLTRGDTGLSDQWGSLQTLPVSFLVNRNGTIVRRYVGGTPELIRSLVRDADAVLDGKPLGSLEAPAQPVPPS